MMGRKRLIDVDNLLFDDELVEALGAGGLWVYPILWATAEDWGGYEPKYGSIALRSGALRLTKEIVEKAIQTLIDMGKILPYQVNGKTYHWIKNFLKHQNLNNPSPPLIPLPPWLKWEEAQYPSGKKYAKYSILQEMLPGNSPETPGRLPVGYQEPTGSPRNETETETKPRLQASACVAGPAAPSADASSPEDGCGISAEAVLDGGNGTEPSKPKFGPANLVEIWNGLGCRPMVSELTEDRRKKAGLRLRKRGDPDWWRRLFEKARDLNKPWLTFDFLMRNDTNALKVLEGNYDHDFRSGKREREPPPPPPNKPLPPEPEGIMVPDPQCQVCRGSGLARDGPCKCLRLEKELTAERKHNGKADHQGVADKRPPDGPGSGTGRAGGHPAETGRTL
jgi:hypothetical protein